MKKKGKKPKNKKLLIAAIIILIIAAGFAIFTLKKPNPRASYELPAAMFEKLPSMPDDFYNVQILILYNKIKDYTTYGPEYWKQPEWFPSWKEGCLHLLKDPPVDRFAAIGIGTFPYKASYVANPGDTVKTVLYIKSGCLIVTYQGVRMTHSFPESARRMADEIFYQDSDVAREHLTVNFDQDEFILEPSYPVFLENSIRRIEIDIKVDPETPSGTYFTAVDTGIPSGEFSEAAYKQYLNRYTPASTAISGQHRFTVFIQVA